MKLEVNVTKTKAFAIIGALIVLAGIIGVIAAVNTALPYHPASQVSLTGGKTLQEAINDGSVGGGIGAYPTVPLSSTGEIFIEGQSYQIAKRLAIPVTGRVRITYTLKSSSSISTAYARLYLKNSGELTALPIGMEQSTTLTSYATNTFDIELAAGDEVQLQLKSSHTAPYAAKTDSLEIKSIEAISGGLYGYCVLPSTSTFSCSSIIVKAPASCATGPVRCVCPSGYGLLNIVGNAYVCYKN